MLIEQWTFDPLVQRHSTQSLLCDDTHAKISGRVPKLENVLKKCADRLPVEGTISFSQ